MGAVSAALPETPWARAGSPCGGVWASVFTSGLVAGAGTGRGRGQGARTQGALCLRRHQGSAETEGLTGVCAPTSARCLLAWQGVCPLDRDDNVQRELRDWGLSFDSNLLSFSGRVLQAEKIHQGGKTVGARPQACLTAACPPPGGAAGQATQRVHTLSQFEYNPQFADWSKETRGAPLISVKPLDNWLLIYTRRNYEAANSLVQNLFKVTPAMGIQMKKAVM